MLDVAVRPVAGVDKVHIDSHRFERDKLVQIAVMARVYVGYFPFSGEIELVW